MANTAYLSLGSNIRPEQNMPAALEMLATATRLVAVSSMWETRPLGVPDQVNFLNGAAVVETELTAAQLKQQVLMAIEERLGRVRQANKNAPRPMDIDIMLFNNEIFNVGRRRIPDPEVLERPFVAIPLAEIAPDYTHPETGQTLAEIARRFDPAPGEMVLRPDVSWTPAQPVMQTKNYVPVQLPEREGERMGETPIQLPVLQLLFDLTARVKN